MLGTPLFQEFYGQMIQTTVSLRKKQKHFSSSLLAIFHSSERKIRLSGGQSYLFPLLFCFSLGKGGDAQMLYYRNCLVLSSPALSASLQMGVYSPGVSGSALVFGSWLVSRRQFRSYRSRGARGWLSWKSMWLLIMSSSPTLVSCRHYLHK